MTIRIDAIDTLEILDSRGNPTLRVFVQLDNGITAAASVPSGASTGANEAVELRDGDSRRYGGKGVLKAMAHVTQVIAPALKGMDPCRQAEIDQHCYADGIALIQVVLSMTDKTPDGLIATTPSPARQSAAHPDEAVSDLFRQLFEPVSEAISQAVKTGRDLVEEGVDIALHPVETVDQARQGIGRVFSYARQGLGFVSEASRLLFLADDPPTRFKGKLGVAKRVAWSDPLPVDDVKILGKALGATINDVLLSCVTGALRTYLLEKGEPVDRTLEIRAAVPVNLRSQGQADKLGNFFGMVLLPLPIGIENPLERLAAVHRRMDALRASYQAIMTIGVMEILGLGPPIAQASAMRLLSKKATAVMTNVPGSQEPLYLAGHQITEWMFWVPQSGSVGMGVSIITYGGHVYFGLITDRKRVSDPEAIINRFGKEFEKLVLMTMMGSWDHELEPGR